MVATGFGTSTYWSCSLCGNGGFPVLIRPDHVRQTRCRSGRKPCAFATCSTTLSANLRAFGDNRTIASPYRAKSSDESQVCLSQQALIGRESHVLRRFP